ncbi:YfiR family protein [Rhodobacteraceae bacterium CH30]|nr:YfiR family protein [Rhodobacteraceae bacterium CH30]
MGARLWCCQPAPCRTAVAQGARAEPAGSEPDRPPLPAAIAGNSGLCPWSHCLAGGALHAMRRICLGLLASLALAGSVWAGEAAYKAVFVYKLLDFVQWPDATTSGRRLCVAVSDTDWPAFRALEGQDGLKVERLLRDASLANCSVVYLGEMPTAELSGWARRIEREPVLSVCENWRCARDGVMLGLGLENSRLYFEFNSQVMSRSGLKLSSRLLRLARTVY